MAQYMSRPNKEKIALPQAALRSTLFADDSNTSACAHKRMTLLRFDCGAGHPVSPCLPLLLAFVGCKPPYTSAH
jgi:hypothetical protein